MEPVVHLREAVCLLGRFPALAGVTLDVMPGEILLVQGPNGAGKSTLLRMCAGLLGIASGSVEVLGCDLADDRRSVRPRVGLLGHGAGLYEDLSVVDNVRFWAKAARRTDDGVDEALRTVGLDGRLRDVAASRLSSGQRRRTALAVLIARRPELWLLDEPHAGLDPEGRDLVDRLMTAAVASGATVMFASHDLDRAALVANRSVTVAGGIVVDAAPVPVDGPGASHSEPMGVGSAP